MIRPRTDGTKILKRKIENAARNPTSAGNPIAEMKNIDAPSLMPKSPNEIDGIKDFTKSVNIPESRNANSKGLLANAAVSTPYCKATTTYKQVE
ncbi:MAG: hypothetical protein WC727_03495 [Ignavibacteriaceae bacterium]